MSKSKDTQNLEGDFRDFLWYLEDFLSANALFQTKDIKIVYCQEPQQSLMGFMARGLMQMETYTFPFTVEYDLDTNILGVESEAFTFHINKKELESFLQHEKQKKGGKE